MKPTWLLGEMGNLVGRGGPGNPSKPKKNKGLFPHGMLYYKKSF